MVAWIAVPVGVIVVVWVVAAISLEGRRPVPPSNRTPSDDRKQGAEGRA